jgi:hypothetical protein
MSFERHRLRLLMPLVGLLGLTRFAAAQNSSGQRPAVLVGHWRRTRFVYGETIDDNLTLAADGRMTSWQVTATSRSARQPGRWRVEGKHLMLHRQGDEEGGAPYFIHEGRLVFPNIPNQRQFWDRVE